jgi:hypothetical protein
MQQGGWRIGGENDRAGGPAMIEKGQRADDDSREPAIRWQQVTILSCQGVAAFVDAAQTKKAMVALADGILTKRNLVQQWIHGEKQFLSKMKARNDGDEV